MAQAKERPRTRARGGEFDQFSFVFVFGFYLFTRYVFFALILFLSFVFNVHLDAKIR